MSKHGERAHSKFSASGAERWLACPGSVELSEGIADQANVWSIEGTKAHEVLEAILKKELSREEYFLPLDAPPEMLAHAKRSARFLLGLSKKHPEAKLMVETRVYLSFIHPEMFGTFDGAILDHFGTLHIYDFKYGRHYVSPNKNLQMIFYAIGVAHEHHWNFKKVRLWIDQPRIPNYDGPMFWEIGILDLKKYVEIFSQGVARVLSGKKEYSEGPHCHWCRAKNICPMKSDTKKKKVLAMFAPRR